MIVKSSSDLIKGINSFIRAYPQSKLSKSGISLNTSENAESYFSCKINRIPYWLAFWDEKLDDSQKCFIHLYGDLKDRPSVVQFTISNSNFKISDNKFYLIQNHGATIGKKVLGLEKEFKALMAKNGFNTSNIVVEGDCINPNYSEILEQLFYWLKVRVKTKLQLEEKYRNIEDRVSENETNLNFDNIGDIESRTEGGKKVIISVRKERNSALRAEAIRIHGLKCKCCDFDFQEAYGIWGKDYIEVHHVSPLGSGGERETNAKTDLTVVCSNCHRMIHRKRGFTLTIEELKLKLKRL